MGKHNCFMLLTLLLLFFWGCDSNKTSKSCYNDLKSGARPITIAAAIDSYKTGLFLCQLKEYMENNNENKVADMMCYPLLFSNKGVKSKIESKKVFMDNYQGIITDKVLKAVLNANLKSLVSYQGGVTFRESTGLIWINECDSSTKEIKIITINLR